MRIIGIVVLGIGALILIVAGLLGQETNLMLGLGGSACVAGAVLYVILNKQADKK